MWRLGKSKMREAGRLETQELQFRSKGSRVRDPEEPELQLKFKGRLPQKFPHREGRPFLLVRPSASYMMYTHTIGNNLLCLEPAN